MVRRVIAGLCGAKLERASVLDALHFYNCFGGAEGDRTPDLMTASHALSQLSYGPKCGNVVV